MQLACCTVFHQFNLFNTKNYTIGLCFYQVVSSSSSLLRIMEEATWAYHPGWLAVNKVNIELIDVG